MTETPAVEAAVADAARRARAAANELALATRAVKDAALEAMADALVASTAQLLDANAHDLTGAKAAELTAAQIDRLRLTPERIQAMATGRQPRRA